ncbi:helix-hairpin-helix domain-containing protein [Acinetobacter baumannii]|uniref:helix-hairpin-helix domain-containing protein n=1 Tax=Acinetobacter baumannii TaxID=470 RepID=UPI001DFA5A18|nr:helix-hairpin-helix domain-containing protein [Acinetobacter baumannii]EHU1307128.1 helix-hairpin-helix domain-containing protein [Acinetobacter baumannii]EHU2440797.1 helix-hairpin-helix domain-containing protein [Acinetobacter baumannii]MDH2600612.1 helix-hairpin-helix domain-containing protein [Acinetobacter baumannii]
MSDKKAEALKIVEDGLNELESSKSSITVAVQKLSRAAKLLNEDEIIAWTQLHLGNQEYTTALDNFFKKVKIEAEKLKDKNQPVNVNATDEFFKKELKKIIDLHLPLTELNESFSFKTNPKAGGFNSVDFIENKLNTLIREKIGNDGYHYKNPLQAHITYIKKYAFKYLTELHEKLKFSGTITSSFDLLKNAVDDRLLDLDPELAEQLILAFKAVSSDNKEEWSHALTTCRRLLESLADKLYPANDLVINKRTFKQGQFVNRLWQFMNDAIESESNRDLAQTHVNFLGSWLEKTNKLTNKGVHFDVSQLEATKAVFHLYLMLADLLDHLTPSKKQSTKPHISSVTLDEIEIFLNVKREVAKAIWLARANNNGLTLEQLKEVKGVGAKTLTTAQEVFEFN